MTALCCRRGEVRAALAAVLPHAGKATDDTPDYGRVRFHAGADELLAWTTDGFTAATARMTIDEHLDDELDEWDMSVHDVKAVLAVLKRPGNADERSVWDSAECRIELTGKRVSFKEAGDLFGGRDVTVNRLERIDTYPDVPRGVHLGLTTEPPTHPFTNLRTDLLARFVASAKAYEQVATLRTTEAHSLLVTIGTLFVGHLRTLRLVPDDAAGNELTWADTLAPLRQPVVPEVPDDVMENLRDQAAHILADRAPAGTTLTVVLDGEGP